MKLTHGFTPHLVALGSVFLLATTTLANAESAGDAIDDTTVTTKVKAELLKDQALKSLNIHVDTSQDVVHLSGTVPDSVNKADAERVAQGVAGVRSVQDDIVVQPNQ